MQVDCQEIRKTVSFSFIIVMSTIFSGDDWQTAVPSGFLPSLLWDAYLDLSVYLLTFVADGNNAAAVANSR